MKNIFIFAFCLLTSALLWAGPIEIPADAVARMIALANATNSLNTAVHALEVSATAVEGQIIAQADTNVTTTVTAYTPRFVGDTLVGGAGAGTNAVWISNGVTTNNWVAIKP